MFFFWAGWLFAPRWFTKQSTGEESSEVSAESREALGTKGEGWSSNHKQTRVAYWSWSCERSSQWPQGSSRSWRRRRRGERRCRWGWARDETPEDYRGYCLVIIEVNVYTEILDFELQKICFFFFSFETLFIMFCVFVQSTHIELLNIDFLILFSSLILSLNHWIRTETVSATIRVSDRAQQINKYSHRSPRWFMFETRQLR